MVHNSNDSEKSPGVSGKQARQGSLGRPVLQILFGATIIAVIAMMLAYAFVLPTS